MLVTLRDDPIDAPIPERFEPSDYYPKKLAQARLRLAECESMSLEAADVAAAAQFAADADYRENSIAKNRSQIEKYRLMRDQVVAWVPPTASHVEMKTFMLSQIDESVRFDSSEEYYRDNPIRRLGAAEWLEAESKKALRDIEYFASEEAKEIARCESRTAWVQALLRSL